MSSRKLLPPHTSSKSLPSAPAHTTFDSCDHLRRLLGSQARDLVLRNYNLSLKILCLAFPAPSKALPPKFPERRKLLKLRGAAVKCSHCSNALLINLICLQCRHVGCYDDKHALGHSKAQHHMFAILTFGQLFCFKCQDYVGAPELEAQRIALLVASQRLSSAPGMPVYPFAPNLSDKTRALVEQNLRPPLYKASTGLKGFVNMGSTCYMSTILQTFVHNPFIREYFLLGAHAHCTTDQCVTCRIDEVFVDFFTLDSSQGYGLTRFLATCWRINRSLAGYSQQDAHEFWQFVLGEFHKTHSKSLEGPCQCITHKVFAGELQSSVRCGSCGRVTKKIDPVLDLLLDIKHKSSSASSVEECLTRFTSPEALEGGYSCDHCGKQGNASKKLSVKSLGPVLAVQLKRFEHLPSGQSLKVEDPVSFPVILDMKQYCTRTTSESKQDGEMTYELFAVVCHIGQVNTGHYICMVKNSDGQWFKFDDSMVTLITQKQALETNAYLLFYIRHQF